MSPDLALAIEHASRAALTAGHVLGPWRSVSAHLSVAACAARGCVFEVRAWDIDAQRVYEFVRCPFTAPERHRVIEDPRHPIG